MSYRGSAIRQYAPFIGLRYSFSRKRNRFTSVIALVSMLGMVIGVASLITGVFIILQPPGRTAVTIEEQGTFIPATSAMAPAAFDQDPRSDEEVEYEPVVPPESDLEAPLEFTDTEVSGAAA